MFFDEVGFWRDESTSLPDVETYRAVLPALATTRGLLVGISSPYAQRGLLYTKHRDCFGKDDPEVLVVQAPTTAFNPSIDTKVIDDAMRDDPEAAAAEWHAEFRSDLSTFVDRAVVEACVERGRGERPFVPSLKYSAFADPSGGQSDSFTLAIAHREGERVLLDAVREWKAPFDPGSVVQDVVNVLRAYRCMSVRGDRYAAEWVVSEFRKHAVSYQTADLTRSEIYLGALPLLMSGNAILLDNPRLVGQLAQLERRTMKTGRDSIDHMRGAQDDLANAVAGALVSVNTRGPQVRHYDAPAPRVLRQYAKQKGNLGQPIRISTKEKPMANSEVQRMIEMTAAEPVEKHMIGDHWIQLHDKDNDGRERFSIHRPSGECVAKIRGRGNAEASCRELIEKGSITR